MSNGTTTASLPLHAFGDLSPEQARNIDEVCDYFEHHLYTGGQPSIEALLGGFREPERSILLRELVWLELETYRTRGDVPHQSEYCGRFPGHEPLIREVFAALFPAPVAPLPPPGDGPVSSDDWPTIPNYRILRELSHGAMGTVFEALHTRLGSRVAIKVLREKLAKSVEAEVWFEREMKVIGTLNHPNIVAARDGGTFEGRHYLVMEYIEGLDVGDVLNRLRTLPVGDACEIARSAALALQHAHEHRLVHRDIKPRNILLGRIPDGGGAQVKVADFGLASLLGYAALRDPQVPYARIAGTFAFMAPEQYWKRSADIRSDIYGLGCTLYCLLLARPPFPPSNYERREDLMEAHRSHPVPDIRRLRPDVSETLESILRKMLAKSPADRFPCPRDVAQALLPFAAKHDLAELLDRAETTPHQDSAFPRHFRKNPFAAGRAPAPAPATPQVETSNDSSLDLEDTISWDGVPPAEPEPKPATPPPIPQRPPDRTPDRIGTPKRTGWEDWAAWAGWKEPEKELRLAKYRSWIAVIGVGLLSMMIVLLLLATGRIFAPAHVDLLANVDPARDSLAGAWRWEGNVLVSPETDRACLQIPYRLPEQYRLEVQAERLSGGRLVIGLIWQDRKVPVVLGAMARVTMLPRDGQTTTDRRAIPSEFDLRGPPNTYVCIVRREGIVVAFENQVRYTHWPDELPPITRADWMNEFWADPHLLLGTEQSAHRFHRIALTPLDRCPA